MKRRDFLKAGGAAAVAGLGALPVPALAQARKDTLLTLSESGPNSLDIHGVGANRPAYEASWNTYDRLMTYGVKQDANGNDHYDYARLEPELAEEWDLRDTGVTFKLRRDAVFHDGSPVTAQDVKWSFDRAVSIGGFPTFQMKAGSLEKPEQFVVVDDHTLRIDFLRHDKLTMPDLAVPVPVVINSGLAKKHATAADPWAAEWLKNNSAGGGAFRVEKWTPGQELVYLRHDKWRSGPPPRFQRVIWRMVPSAGNRRALLERGDADISVDLPPKDVLELSEAAKLGVVATPIENQMQYVGMSARLPPFDKLAVRQAVAYAIPYQKIMEAALYKQGRPLFGGPAQVTTAEWPQPAPFATDLARAKQLLAEGGYAQGFETTLSFDLGLAVLNEPICVLLQESLAEIGIKTTINKVPGANWRNELLKKTMPLFTNTFGGWLNFPDYFFYWSYHGQDAVFNTMSYRNPEMDKLIDDARFATDPATYAADVEGFIRLAWQDVPRVPLFQQYLAVAMQKSITGYRYWFHRQLDYRQLGRA
jgi:peptide/nickel transport system substrate-binding protein